MPKPFYREIERAEIKEGRLILYLTEERTEEFGIEGVRIEGDINQINQARFVGGILADYDERDNYNLGLLKEREGESAATRRKYAKGLIKGFDDEIKLNCFRDILTGKKEVESYGYEKICRIERGNLQYQEETTESAVQA